MIQQVSFKNFRRFANFPELNLGEINIFVGRNNAGKSTVLKALQLMKGNLNTLSNISSRGNIFASMKPMFVFDVGELAELHIDNFDRALYNKAERKEITLSVQISECKFTIVLDGQNIEQNSYYVAVPYNFIELENNSFHLTFDFQTRDLHFSIKSELGKQNEKKLAALKAERDSCTAGIAKAEFEFKDLSAKLHGEQANMLSTVDMIDVVSKRQKLETVIKNGQKQLTIIEADIAKLEKENSGLTVLYIKNLPEYSDTVKVNIIDQIFKNISDYAYTPLTLDQRTKEYKQAYEAQEKIKAVHEDLMSVNRDFISALSDFDMEYIHAHAASQKVIYLKEDKTDVLSRSLSEFCKARIVPGNKEWNFVKKWMDRFEIGKDFRIKDVDSAGYMLRIFDEGEDPDIDKGMNLADKGTGSIQLMTLLLSLAIIMHKVETEPYFPTVLIEEPEQNIHPMLQSLLADLFLEFRELISEYMESQLIIETHSEYLIRRTQVLVSEANYKTENDLLLNNPFNVVYFDKESIECPFYHMEYNTAGGFKRSFMPGFFDEASKLDMEIIRKERELASSYPMDATSLANLLNG